MSEVERFKDTPFLATDTIGDHLAGGSFVLFLGAGVSQGFGLPSWSELVARVIGRSDDEQFRERLEAMSDREMAKQIDSIDTGDAVFASTVHRALYREVAPELSNQL